MGIRELGRGIRQLCRALVMIVEILVRLVTVVNKLTRIFVIAFTPIILFASMTGHIFDNITRVCRVMTSAVWTLQRKIAAPPSHEHSKVQVQIDSVPVHELQLKHPDHTETKRVKCE